MCASEWSPHVECGKELRSLSGAERACVVLVCSLACVRATLSKEGCSTGVTAHFARRPAPARARRLRALRAGAAHSGPRGPHSASWGMLGTLGREGMALAGGMARTALPALHGALGPSAHGVDGQALHGAHGPAPGLGTCWSRGAVPSPMGRTARPSMTRMPLPRMAVTYRPVQEFRNLQVISVRVYRKSPLRRGDPNCL